MSDLKLPGHMETAYYQYVKAVIIVIGADFIHHIRDHVLKWKSDVESILPKNIPILVLINKVDLCQCGISNGYITKELRSIEIYNWLDISAKDGINIESTFKWMAQLMPSQSNRSSEKYVGQCVKNIENLIYDIDARTIGRWVYDVVIPRTHDCKSNYTCTLQAVMTDDQYSQFEMALKFNDFIIHEAIKESEVIQDRVYLKIQDSDNQDITTIRIIIVKHLDDLQDVEVAELKAHRNKFQEDDMRVNQLQGHWMDKVTFLDEDTFTQLSNVSTFAQRIYDDYLYQGWTLHLGDISGEKINYDETKKILYVEESVEVKLSRYEEQLRDKDEIIQNLVKFAKGLSECYMNLVTELYPASRPLEQIIEENIRKITKS